MRAFTSAILLAAAAAALGAVSGTPALAQSGHVHHNFCLLTGPARECAYQTMDQCIAAKRGNADFCEPNDAPLNHPSSRGRYQ
jgi:hypothetical protein